MTLASTQSLCRHCNQPTPARRRVCWRCWKHVGCRVCGVNEAPRGRTWCAECQDALDAFTALMTRLGNRRRPRGRAEVFVAYYRGRVERGLSVFGGLPLFS